MSISCIMFSKNIYNKREELENECAKDTHYIFSKDREVGKADKCFIAFDKNDAEDMELMKQALEEDNNLYEIIYPSSIIKPYFDLEIETEEENHKQMGLLFIDTAIEYIFNTYDIDLVMEDFAVFDSCRAGKLSYHLLIQNKICFETMAHQKIFAMELFQYIKNNQPSLVWGVKQEKTIMDILVYGKCQNFRMPNQSKKGKNHILKNVSDISIMDCFITLNDKGDRQFVKIDLPASQPEKEKREVIQEEQHTNDIDKNDWIKLLMEVIKNEKLNGVRLVSRAQWFSICGVLKANGFSKNVWLAWSRLSSTTDTAEKQWDRLHNPLGGIGTLVNIAKDVNLKGYQEWCKDQEEITIYIKKKTDPLITDDILTKFNKLRPYHSAFTTGLIADIFKLLYEDRFKYVPDGKTGIMYHFNGVYWKPDCDSSFINNFVDKDFVKILNALPDKERAKYTTLLDDEDQSDKASEMIEKIDSFRSTANFRLRINGMRSDYIKDICHRLADSTTIWNKNPYLFAFENVIYDLKTQQQVKPNPKDYINMTCGYEYDLKYDKEVKCGALMGILDQIFVDKELQDYYLEILATGMCGLRIEKVFIGSGKGGNGKSLLNGLASKTMGNYAYDLPASLMSEKIKLGPNPEAAGLHEKRLVFFTEPDEKSPLCCSVLKTLTGEDVLGVRNCFSNKVGIFLRLTFIGSCNNKPDLDEVNDAVSRRMRGAIIPFNSKFVSQSTINELEIEFGEKPANVFLGKEFYISQEFKEEYKQALFEILLSRFGVYQTNNLDKIPAIVLSLSRAYMAGSDDIYEWFEDTYEKNSDSMVFIDDVFSEFSLSTKLIQMTKMEKRKFGTISKFKDKLESNLFIGRYYRPKDKYWKGERLKKPFIEGWNLKPENLHQQQGQKTTE